MAQYRFKQVDVFTARPFYGNPVAVVLDADDVESADMQRIARWTNLSETTFVLRPTVSGADYRLRIFTPTGELPFAGHPTVGSAHAVLEAGIVPPAMRLTQECLAGLLPLTISGDGAQREISVQVPVPKIVGEHAPSVNVLAAALGGEVSLQVAPLAIDVGPVWLVAYVNDVESVRRLDPDMAALARLSRELQVTGVTVFSLGGSDGAATHVRSFAPAAGVPEDPVCGSGNASVGAFLAHTGLLQRTGTSYAASQGTELGRAGQVRVQVNDDGRQVSIGGHAVTVIDGTLRL
jgi:PhzF family phenazine biosynthesis protein